jgi:ORF41
MKTLLKLVPLKLSDFKEELKRGKDMMIKLYAVNVVAGVYPFAKVPKVLKAKVKQQIALMVEDDEILAELTKE